MCVYVMSVQKRMSGFGALGVALGTAPSPRPQNTAQSSSKPLLALQRQLPDHSAQLDAKQLVPSKNPPQICHVRSHFSGSFLPSRHSSSPL